MINVTLFSQVLQIIPRDLLKKITVQHGSDKHSKGIDTWNHLVSMLFCHFGKLNSLRDISNGMKVAGGNLNHLGVQRPACKSSLSYENARRDWRVFQSFYYALLQHISGIHKFQRKPGIKLRRKIFLLDSTVISLCLKVFDWAKFRAKKGAVKIHTLLDYDGCLPSYLYVSDGKTHDVTAAKEITVPPGSVLVMDKAYVDFKWLYILDSTGVFFVTRVKDNAQYRVVGNNPLKAEDKGWILEDKIVELTGFYTQKHYPNTLRLVRIWDEKNQIELTFMTNNTSWTASTIAELYKARWDIEIFFKQIKQHLKIKSFVGTSENAVMIQIWTAMISMLILTYLKAKAKFKWHLSGMITFLRLNLFVKINLWRWLDKPFDKPPDEPENYQLKFF
jgi:hypothetical protein